MIFREKLIKFRAMETAEDEWWMRMERAKTIDYSVRASAPGASNPELMELQWSCWPRLQRVRQYPRSCWLSPNPAVPFPRKAI
ncbi:hypothetical protein CDAR_568121 [Caerostris darwini]|uniref:Uncharacterized protein n=1 Tax=Caerostris darwini TaxID=1538125 RepID=A0AAV4UTT2_9ARAC|nr:hypothetical protein CDAR_568121 [Caerostris darwini]